MLTQVAVLGRGPTRDQDLTAGRRLLHHPVEDEGGLLARLAPATHAVVLAEERDRAVLRRITSGVAVDGDTVPVVGLALPHGPLALSVLGALAATSPASPACLLAWLDRVAAATWSAAWVTSVSGLDSPAPSLGQHLRSWLPGGEGFLLEHAPTSRVMRVRGEPAVGGPVPEGAEALPAAALGVALRAARGDHLIASASDAHPRYGGSVVELAAQPDPLPALPPEGDLPGCPVCGIPVPQPVCPFCRVRVTRVAQEVS